MLVSCWTIVSCMVSCTVEASVVRVRESGLSCDLFHSSLQSSLLSWFGPQNSCPSGVCPASCCLVGHLASTCPLVLHFEQYGSSGQSLFRCPSCLQQKQSRSSCPLDFPCCLLHFTPSPLVDFGMLCCGKLGTFWGATAAGMKGLADGLICDPLEGVVGRGLGCGSTCLGECCGDQLGDSLVELGGS